MPDSLRPLCRLPASLLSRLLSVLVVEDDVELPVSLLFLVPPKNLVRIGTAVDEVLVLSVEPFAVFVETIERRRRVIVDIKEDMVPVDSGGEYCG